MYSNPIYSNPIYIPSAVKIPTVFVVTSSPTQLHAQTSQNALLHITRGKSSVPCSTLHAWNWYFKRKRSVSIVKTRQEVCSHMAFSTCVACSCLLHPSIYPHSPRFPRLWRHYTCSQAVKIHIKTRLPVPQNHISVDCGFIRTGQ